MNVLIIFADQMHKYALGKVSDYVVTPNLDKLCEQGVLFTNAYSNNPVCGPFRGVLFTGQYANKSGVIENNDPLPLNIPRMADVFNDAGYNTSFVGKWHLGGAGNKPIPKEIRGGFQRFIGYQCYNNYFDGVCFYDEDDNEIIYDKHRTLVETQLSIERIKELHKEGKPFLHVVGYQAPHYPVQPSPKFEEMYEGVQFPKSVDFIETNPYTPTGSPPSPKPFENDPNYQKYGNNMQEYLKLYYAMVTEVDEGIGRIINTLEELKIKDDTIIIFTSDHGDMQGSHGFNNKVLPYEKSAGVPMIISVPGGRKNEVSDSLISGIDIYPTLLDLCGIRQQSHLQGHSVAGYLNNKGDMPQFPVFSEIIGKHFSENWKMVVYEGYKMVIDWRTMEPTLLFNLKEDPYEMNNLINDNKYQPITEKLKPMIYNF